MLRANAHGDWDTTGQSAVGDVITHVESVQAGYPESEAVGSEVFTATAVNGPLRFDSATPVTAASAGRA
ncbi:hypothetical protein GCM10025868_40840 [Angustibacter aerolatus]|uniref:Uncharacterized protein n=1 Tax=Angustibacter aerolatus TaxID=1162965 RepID=A0ABQ6JNX1_9ACTN|nr:hypothetical protein [Angustibacter aerolatus]GMA88834.1 hypothetical protein GCM10025868_40840 [Angustibacter aerolatus]